MDFVIDILKQALSLLVSFGLIGVIAFICREYLKRYIEHMFKEREADSAFEHKLELEKIRTFIPIFQEIAELVYKIRNYARELLDAQTPLHPTRELYTDCCSLFSERLYRYRALIDKELFGILHRLKRLSQDFLLTVDVADRIDELKVNNARFSPEHLLRLQTIYKQIDELYLVSTEAVQEKLHIEAEMVSHRSNPDESTD